MPKEKDQKAAILGAAQTVLSHKGAEAATLDDVAKEAKIDLKQVKAAYATIELVVEELIGRDVTEVSELFTKIINDRGKADIKLTRLVRELLTRYQKSYTLFQLMSVGIESAGADEAAD